MGSSRSVHWTSPEADIAAPCRRPDLVEKEIGGEVLIYDRSNDQSHMLNETALVVWRRCDGRATMRDIAVDMTDKYDVDFDTALDHVEQLVAKLAQLQLFSGR